MLAIGSTLQMYSVASVVPLARDAGAKVVIVNNEATAMDELPNALLRSATGETLPAICAA